VVISVIYNVIKHFENLFARFSQQILTKFKPDDAEFEEQLFAKKYFLLCCS